MVPNEVRDKLVKEKLVNGDTFLILEQLCSVEFGEHNILIYSDLDALREIYSHYCKKLLEDNEIVLLLPHYENPDYVRNTLKEIEIDVKKYEEEGSLIIMDSVDGFFGTTIDDFIHFIKSLETRASNTGKKGVSLLVDMGSFYHVDRIDDLIRYEKSIPARAEKVKSSLICCYHKKDFDTLNEEQKEVLCKHHYRNLMVSSVEE